MTMLDFWRYAGKLGYCYRENCKFLLKYGESLSVGKYLNIVEDIIGIKEHMPSNHVVEIYLED